MAAVQNRIYFTWQEYRPDTRQSTKGGFLCPLHDFKAHFRLLFSYSYILPSHHFKPDLPFFKQIITGYFWKFRRNLALVYRLLQVSFCRRMCARFADGQNNYYLATGNHLVVDGSRITRPILAPLPQIAAERTRSAEVSEHSQDHLGLVSHFPNSVTSESFKLDWSPQR